jgi:hypothetical protein
MEGLEERLSSATQNPASPAYRLSRLVAEITQRQASGSTLLHLKSSCPCPTTHSIGQVDQQQHRMRGKACILADIAHKAIREVDQVVLQQSNSSNSRDSGQSQLPTPSNWSCASTEPHHVTLLVLHCTSCGGHRHLGLHSQLLSL